MKINKAGASYLALAIGAGLMASSASAQTAPDQTQVGDQANAAGPEAAPDDVIVTGTRTTGMRAADSPAPIQLLGADALTRTGSVDVTQSLAQNLPQVQAQAFGTDLQQVNLQLRLRGLSPNHTLILVNGKRRHGSANVSVAGGPFGGSAAPDISFILPNSIDHVEVLQDGAAAQYGTDAIAGVINFIQKSSDHGGALSLQGGRYYDQGGKTYTIDGNIGLEPFDGAYLNISAEKKHKDSSFRGDINPAVYGNNATAIQNLARFPLSTQLAYYPYVNRRVGDPLVDQTSVMYNAGYKMGDYELYTFGSYGHKNATADENSRIAGQIYCIIGQNGCTAPASINETNRAAFAGQPAGGVKLFYPAGFQPQQRISETDYSVTGGFRGSVNGTTFDIASTYGSDFYQVYVQRSGNARLYLNTGYTPTSFYIGDLRASQWSNTLDVTHEFDAGLSEPVTVAGGLEYRREKYTLGAGDSSSYYGSGSESFFGFTPLDASSHSRTNFSEYLDVSLKPVSAWLVDGAVRHEHYSDFGNTTVFKLTSRYDISPAFAIRGTASTGFRAPTLAEEFYRGINVSTNYVSGIFAPNSAAAQGLGFGNLGPEKSRNYSAGIVLHPTPRLSMTLDAYQITLTNRIVLSSLFYGYRGAYCPPGYVKPAGSAAPACTSTNQDLYNIYNQTAVYNAVAAAIGGTIPSTALYFNNDPAQGRATDGGYAGLQTFVNGVKMRTRGIDFLAAYSTPIGGGRIDWSLSANYNANKVQGIRALPSALYTSTANPTLTQLIDRFSVASLEQTSPKFRANLGAALNFGIISANIRENYYSSIYTLGTTPSNSPLGSGVDFQTKVHSAFITDLEVGVEIAPPIRLSIGANNLLNHYPTKTSAYAIRDPQLATGSSTYAGNLYPTSSPFGYNGGFYYGRINVKF